MLLISSAGRGIMLLRAADIKEPLLSPTDPIREDSVLPARHYIVQTAYATDVCEAFSVADITGTGCVS